MGEFEFPGLYGRDSLSSKPILRGFTTLQSVTYEDNHFTKEFHG